MTAQQHQQTHQRRQHMGTGPFSRWIDEILNTNLGDVFDSAFVATKPFVNVYESEAAYELVIAAPGLSKEAFKLEMKENMLHISADVSAQPVSEGTELRSKEFDFNKFHRIFRISEQVDPARITAKYENGLLNVSMPKRDKDTWKKEIPVE